MSRNPQQPEPPAPITEPAPPAAEPGDDPIAQEQVTYLPDPEDPPQVQYGGHTFSANLPKTVALPT